jgi:hypothetical protein
VHGNYISPMNCPFVDRDYSTSSPKMISVAKNDISAIEDKALTGNLPIINQKSINHITHIFSVSSQWYDLLD